MASQWNEEFLSHFTPPVREGRTLRSDDGRLVFMRSTDEEFVQINEDQTGMQELDLLMMRSDLAAKASDVVCEADAQHVRHSSSHDGFDGTELSLVSSESSLSIHPDQTHLEDLLSQHTPRNAHQHSSILSVDEDQPHLHLQQQHVDHDHHHHHLEEQPDHQTPPSLLLPQTITFDSSGPHALTEQGMHTDPTPTLHFPQQQCQPLASTTATQVSLTQLPCQDSHPIPSFHLNEDILGTSSLNSKLSCLVSEQNSRTDECSSSFSSPTTTLSFLPTNPPLPIIVRNMDVITSVSNPVSLSSNSEMTNMGACDTSNGKAKKRKIADKTCGDMVWLNSKSLSSRQRDRQATQTLIEIVSHPKWQEKLNSSTTKKKTVWREIGEEFTARGYFLENPGKKCFQKWRNLERSFREYELSKKMSSDLNKSLPDFYQELQPILSEKLSLNGLLGEKGDKDEGINERLMEKYIDFDCGPSDKGGAIDSLSMPAFSQNMNSSDHLQDIAGTTNSSRKSEAATTASEKQNLSKQRKQGKPSGENNAKSGGNHELMTHVVEGLKLQRKELAQMNSSLQSIKGLLEEQKEEREKTNAESKSRFQELKAMIDRNQKEKMAFMYEFLKSIKRTQNQNDQENT